MKLFKKSIALFAAALLFVLSFSSTPITADAAESELYYVKYVDSISEWRFQKGTWDENGHHRELYYLYQDIKDGDTVVIDGAQPIDFSVNVVLKNLTVSKTTMALISAKGYDEVYVLNNTTASISGDVKYAEVYGASHVNFNNNVGELRVLSESDILAAHINVIGTVDHLYGGVKDNYKLYEYYSFKPNSLTIEHGIVFTDASKYSETPQNTNTNTSTNNKNDEYDEVPKTGDDLFNPLWLVAIAAVCLVGARKLK